MSRKEIEEKGAIMAKELSLAQKIHKSIMPHSFKNELIDIAITYKPMLYMGGDYAKFEFTDKDKIMFFLADVTGHGVSSALLVNRIHSEVQRLVEKKLEPGQMLKVLDEFIEKSFGQMGYFLSVFCGLVDLSSHELVYSNYGHPPQILLQSSDNNVVLMKAQTFFMGIGMDTKESYATTVPFQKGDRLILFTDGIIEAKNEKGEMFGQEKLEQFTKQNNSCEVDKFNKNLIETVDLFQGHHQSDDIFLLTVEIK
jgi:sigma-B regulation protein RsbU (phosphoserine phosphatase)